MAKIVRLTMGGIVYTVSYSFLFEIHPNSRIAQIASEQLQSSPDDDVVLEWDGDRLKFVLEYLQGKGHVILPRTIPKAVYLADLFYYGITNVDESKIVRISTLAGLRYRRQWEGVVRAEIKSWNIRIAIGLLAKVCVVNHLTSGEKLVIAIQHDDVTRLSLLDDTPTCSLKLWMELRALLLLKGKKSFCPTREGCNKYLRKVIGLEIARVTTYQGQSGMDQSGSAMEVTMKVADNDSDTSDEANAFAGLLEGNM